MNTERALPDSITELYKPVEDGLLSAQSALAGLESALKVARTQATLAQARANEVQRCADEAQEVAAVRLRAVQDVSVEPLNILEVDEYYDRARDAYTGVQSLFDDHGTDEEWTKKWGYNPGISQTRYRTNTIPLIPSGDMPYDSARGWMDVESDVRLGAKTESHKIALFGVEFFDSTFPDHQGVKVGPGMLGQFETEDYYDYLIAPEGKLAPIVSVGEFARLVEFEKALDAVAAQKVQQEVLGTE